VVFAFDRSTRFGCLLALLAAFGCTEESQPAVSNDPAPAVEEALAPLRPALAPLHAKWRRVEGLRAATARVPDRSDAGGRAWIEPDPDSLPTRVGRPGRFEIVYEVGPHGIATRGAVFLHVNSVWGWSSPQTRDVDAPGYTTVEASAPDIRLGVKALDGGTLRIRVKGRPLVAGERLTIVYGAGPASAEVDRFAETGSRFWIQVDGNGDREAFVLEDSPTVDVAAGPPGRLVITGPTTIHPGEALRVHLAILDVNGNAGSDFVGRVAFDEVPAGIELPKGIDIRAEDAGARAIEGLARTAGTYRLRARTDSGLAATSNPIVVREGGARVLWGDLHGHSQLSDGTGTVEAYFDYARNVAGLDVVALSDHDHWGALKLDERPTLWEAIRVGTRAAHDPGRFVTLLAYEWTSWIHGHRHVLYFGDEGAIYSSLSTATESPRQLWDALAGQPAMTIAHHSAGGPIATNWKIPPDPILEPVTEVVSVHGSSEAPDSPHVIREPLPGNFVRDALVRGYRLGFIGSGDSHDGHPGLAHLGAPSGGLAAILSEDLSRDGVLEALRARRVYATNGPRILLHIDYAGYGMGATLPVHTADSDGPGAELVVAVVANAPLDRIDVIRTGEVMTVIPADGKLQLTASIPVEGIAAGEFLYVRAVQRDDGAAWSSPIFFE
jgi:hypothetical protein